MIDPDHTRISVHRQCELLSLPRSSYYYRGKGESSLNLELMHLIDEEYTRHPFYGSRRLTAWLRRQGYQVNRKRVTRLMREMGIEAVYPKRNLSRPADASASYPWLLKGLKIIRPNQVWSSDITYIRMHRGFVYLTVVMDWYSRYVLNSEISITMEKEFCIRCLKKALKIAGPEIFNTDQGSQYTSREFTDVLKTNGILISMDGRGRVFDNIFTERLWRSVKYEEVFLHDYESVKESVSGLKRYFRFYNQERPHQALDYLTPAEVHWQNQGNRQQQQIVSGRINK